MTIHELAQELEEGSIVEHLREPEHAFEAKSIGASRHRSPEDCSPFEVRFRR